LSWDLHRMPGGLFSGCSVDICFSGWTNEVLRKIIFLFSVLILQQKFNVLLWGTQNKYARILVLKISKTIFTVLNYSSLWFGAWLSVFYCIKVASFTQSFFIWLKQRIARLMPWMLLGSWVCSFTAAIPFAWDVYSVHDNFTAPLPMTNSSAMRTSRKDNLGLLALFCNAGIGMPLILSVVSSVLLIQSLWIHTRRMQQNASGFRDPSLEAHMKAIKSVCSFLILYIIYFICVHVILFHSFSPLSNAETIFLVLMIACPTGHSLVLIWSNPKFQELPARIWHRINCPACKTQWLSLDFLV
uniref:Taste receptor type 2 n=1 Tax=Catharus ustulatus TaxID=91951 RepID=A0A8C3XXZ2_CATUS